LLLIKSTRFAWAKAKQVAICAQPYQLLKSLPRQFCNMHVSQGWSFLPRRAGGGLTPEAREREQPCSAVPNDWGLM
jgi:hypothetical protein